MSEVHVSALSLDRRPRDAVFAHIRRPTHYPLWRRPRGKGVERVWESGWRWGDVDGVENPAVSHTAVHSGDEGPRWLSGKGMEGCGGRCPHFHTLYYYYWF